MHFFTNCIGFLTIYNTCLYIAVLYVFSGFILDTPKISVTFVYLRVSFWDLLSCLLVIPWWKNPLEPSIFSFYILFGNILLKLSHFDQRMNSESYMLSPLFFTFSQILLYSLLICTGDVWYINISCVISFHWKTKSSSPASQLAWINTIMF